MPVRRASSPRTAASINCHTRVAPAPCPFHISHAQTLLAQLKLPGHTPQASTAPLQNLSAKLVKARHCLHAVNLQVETIRNECDKARREVEASDTEISGMEHEEERLKLQYVESAPAGHYKRVSCCSRRAARAWKPPPRCARSTAGEPSAVGPRSPTGRLTWAPGTRGSPLTSNSHSPPHAGKLTYEKLHASKYAKQQELKLARQGKTKTAKDAYKLKSAIETKQFEWHKAHQARTHRACMPGAMQSSRGRHPCHARSHLDRAMTPCPPGAH